MRRLLIIAVMLAGCSLDGLEASDRWNPEDLDNPRYSWRQQGYYRDLNLALLERRLNKRLDAIERKLEQIANQEEAR